MSQDRNPESIVEGARLGMALKSESGQIFVEEAINLITDNIEAVFRGSSVRDDEIIAIINRTRGILMLLGSMGDKIALARGIAARNLANQALRRKESEE